MAKSGTSATLPKRDETHEPDPALAAIERAMIRIRRRQARRALGRAATEGLEQPPNLDHIEVLDAIDEGGGAEPEATVGDIATRLGIDPSRASRAVKAAIDAGYVRRVASQGDGRRICLELTDEGQGIVDHAHRFRQTLYDRLLNGWSKRDRNELARLLTRFTDAFAE